MKKIVATMAALTFCISCGKDNAEKVKLQFPDDYTKWKKPVKEILDYEVPGHGKSFRVIYANDIAFSPDTGRREGGEAVIMKDGAMIIKESYLKKSDIPAKNYRDLTIMIKDSKNPRALDGWLYCVKKKGKPMMFVKGRMCIGCHEAANDAHPYFDGNKKKKFRDYLFVPFR